MGPVLVQMVLRAHVGGGGPSPGTGVGSRSVTAAPLDLQPCPCEVERVRADHRDGRGGDAAAEEHQGRAAVRGAAERGYGLIGIRVRINRSKGTD